ncbi:2,3-diketo-L-gulonate TRAP transporter [Helicobacter pylori]|nr:2,3-diketo-L-gulonate TRAP transporter [Helicobacter pylori]
MREWRDLRNTPVEANKREFEEIKKMVLYFRDRSLFYLDWYELSEGEIQEQRENVDYNNEFLQLDYSLKNLSRLREYKENYNENYQKSLNDEELQNNLRKWKNGDKPGFFESLFNDLFGK